MILHALFSAFILAGCVFCLYLLRNSVIESQRGRIAAYLSRAHGQSVDPGEIRLDPGLEIQIRHACVSLDETWDLRVADARLGRLGDLLVRGRDEVLRLRSLSGTLAGHLVGEVFVGSPLEGVEVEIDLSFDAIDPATAAFEGTVQVTAFRIEGVAPWSVDLKAQLCLTPGEWRLEHVSGTLAGVSLAGRLAGVPGANGRPTPTGFQRGSM